MGNKGRGEKTKMNKGRREGQGERANNNKEFSYVFVWCLFRFLIGPKSGQNPKKKKHPNLQPHIFICVQSVIRCPPSFTMATNKSGGGAVSWSERLARQQVWNAQSSVPDSFPLPPLIEFCASTSSGFEGEAERLAFVSEDKAVRVDGPFIQFDDSNKMVYVNDGRFFFSFFSFFFLYLFFFFFFLTCHIQVNRKHNHWANLCTTHCHIHERR